MSVNENCCDGFCHFYRDESLVGHLFLRPSIFVADGYKWIFSDLTGDTCNSIIEVISRIILFIFLPIIALLSSIFIPIGLTCKGIASLCTPPVKPKQEKVPVRVNNALKKRAHTSPKTVKQETDKQNQPKSVTQPQQEPPLSSGVNHPVNNKPSIVQLPPVIQEPAPSIGVNHPVNNKPSIAQPPPVIQEPPKPALSAHLIQQLQVANAILDQAEKVLNGITIKKIDIGRVHEAKKILNNFEVSQLMCEVPQKNDSTSPLCIFSDKYSFLLGKAAELERLYTFEGPRMAENGELQVADNGDCLFESFYTQANMNGPLYPPQSHGFSILNARRSIFDNLIANYRDNEDLQRQLACSCIERYQIEMEKLELERQQLEVVVHTQSGVDPSRFLNAIQRLPKIIQEKKSLFIEIFLKQNEKALNILIAAYEKQKQSNEFLEWMKANYNEEDLQLTLTTVIGNRFANMERLEMERQERKTLISTLNDTNEHAEAKLQITKSLTATCQEMKTQFKELLEIVVGISLMTLLEDFNPYQYERQATVEWIKDNYNSNTDLQRHLANSITEHYCSKMEQLENERDDLLDFELDPEIKIDPQQKENATKRLKEISQEIETVYKILIQSGKAFGQAHSTDIHFEAVKDLVPIYLNDMSKKGTYGGAAELYALSCRHEICAKVYSKGESKIGNKPFLVINSHFENDLKGACYFTKTRNHYNPYFPT